MSHRWQQTALAIASALVLGLPAPAALALSLGRITVQSALGEPLRAEIDIPEINAEEAASLKTSLASPEAFRSAGLEYNPAMTGMQVSVQRRADGRAYIRLTSDRPINDPFVDMILEASWASGRIVRDYTMLFDPPSLRAPAPPAPTMAQVAPAPAPTAPAATSIPATPNPRAAVPARTQAAAAPPRPAPVPAPPKPAEPPAAPGGQQITVKPGDTASKIANATRPASVSLDQMLVALLRANPNAFINDNINRIRSGAVMSVPGEKDALSLSPAEASRTVIAQSQDFNDFRKKLAENAPSSQLAGADRQASGSVQAKVDEKKAAVAAPDKLTLSKGAVSAQSSADQIAREKQAQEAASRAAELAKNIKDLSSIGAAAPGASAPKPAPASAPAPAPAVAVAAVKPASASAPAASAPAATPPKPVVAKAAAPAPEAETSLLDELLGNPLVAPAAGGLVALLAGFGIYRARQRKKSSQSDSSFLESRLQPDSFFGSSGGQRIDTTDGVPTGSSMVYSPSQLDAADDVDPVAEADVYLAYGRDLQAEEILKEALKSNPGRIAIHQKLLEIYAKRRDAKSFEGVAIAAYKVTSGTGPDWQRVCDMGLGIDPTNTLYEPGGRPKAGDVADVPDIAAAALSTTPRPVTAEAPAATSSVDLDLDLDFSLDDESPAPASAEVAAAASATVSMQAVAAPDNSPPALDIDFALPTDMPALEPDHGSTVSMTAQPAVANNSLPDLDLPTPDFGMTTLESDEFKQEAAVAFGSTSPAPLAASEAGAAKAPADPGMIEFDLGSLSLDLTPPAPAAVEALPEAEVDADADPLATKLALAEEFVAIGDEDGARALIEEVIAEATGDMKIKAQRALSKLS